MIKPVLQLDWPESLVKSFACDLVEVYGDCSDHHYTILYQKRLRRVLDMVKRYARPGAMILDMAAAQGDLSKLVLCLIPRPVRTYIHRLCVNHVKSFLGPMELTNLSAEVSWSAAGRQWDTRLVSGIGGWVEATSHSQGYHGLLRQWWST